MHMTDIRSIAKEHGLKTGKQTKVDLVRHIQLAEGNFSCFATATSGICDQCECLWRADCFALAQKKSN